MSDGSLSGSLPVRQDVAAALLGFFKAMADETRLRIVGLLSQQELSVEQLSVMLGLRPSTVSHHLAKLAEAGLVSARAQSYYNYYRLERAELDRLTALLLAGDYLPHLAADVDGDSFSRKVLKDYMLPDGRLKTIPAHRKKLEVVLRRILASFSPGHLYTEKDVNVILLAFHSDTAALRRALIEFGFLQRKKDGSAYWREP